MKNSKFADFLFFKFSIYLSICLSICLSIYEDIGVVFMISMFGLVSTRLRPCLHIVKITEQGFSPTSQLIYLYQTSIFGIQIISIDHFADFRDVVGVIGLVWFEWQNNGGFKYLNQGRSNREQVLVDFARNNDAKTYLHIELTAFSSELSIFCRAFQPLLFVNT